MLRLEGNWIEQKGLACNFNRVVVVEHVRETLEDTTAGDVSYLFLGDEAMRKTHPVLGSCVPGPIK